MNPGKEDRTRACCSSEWAISDGGSIDADIGSDFVLNTNESNKLEVG
jgi:hypothetical protein